MTMWNTFINLDVNGKVFIIALYALGVLLIITWGRYLSRRLGDGLIYRLITASTKQKVEESKRASSSEYKNNNLQKPEKEGVIWSRLLGKITNSFEKVVLYCSSNNARNNTNQDSSPFHLNGIIGRLKRYVNRKREESDLSHTYHKLISLLADIPS